MQSQDPENGPAAGQPYQVHYLGPPRPPCESERMATIRAIGKIGDNKKPDPEISNILKLMQTVFNVGAGVAMREHDLGAWVHAYVDACAIGCNHMGAHMVVAITDDPPIQQLRVTEQGGCMSLLLGGI